MVGREMVGSMTIFNVMHKTALAITHKFALFIGELVGVRRVRLGRVMVSSM